MRAVVDSTFVSLDGIVNHMDKWHFEYVDDETAALAQEQLDASDALLMGRNTYEGYAAVWPGRDGEYADAVNAMRKYVVSSTLRAPEWANTTVLGGNLLDEVGALKARDGKNILMHGFGPVAKSLLRAGLLDELHLWYHPVFAGTGDLDDMIFDRGMNVALEHTGTRQMSSGVVVLSFRSKTA